MNLYDDLMMLNKFQLELLTNVTVVLLFHDPNDMLGGFSLQEVTTNGGELVYGHYFGKNSLITECKSVTSNKWYRRLFKLKNEDMKYQPMLVK
eukprot:7756269-Ditylum_brightwellii.AAC.1